MRRAIDRLFIRECSRRCSLKHASTAATLVGLHLAVFVVAEVLLLHVLVTVFVVGHEVLRTAAAEYQKRTARI